MRRLPDGTVIHAQVAPDGAYYDIARMEAHSDGHGRAGASAGLVRVPADGFLHLQGGITGAQRVVLVGERRPEERHDAVAHDLVDGTLIAVNRLHHPLEYRVEDLACFLRIAVAEQLHRTFKVGE